MNKSRKQDSTYYLTIIHDGRCSSTETYGSNEITNHNLNIFQNKYAKTDTK